MTLKNHEDKYINDLLYYLDINIKIAGGCGLFDSNGVIKSSYRNMNIEQLARHLFPNGIEFKLHNRQVIKDPLRLKVEIEEKEEGRRRINNAFTFILSTKKF